MLSTAALVLCVAACLALERLGPRLGLVDAPGGDRKVHRHPAPLVGGLAILGVTSLLGVAHGWEVFWVWWAGAFLMCGVGVVDDWHELSAVPKLALQTVAVVVMWGLFLREALQPLGAGPGASLFLALGWILLASNAVNYTDNCNGLCGGLSAVSLSGEAAMLGVAGRTEESGILMVMVGAVCGFLLLNFSSGRVFLGDAGSLLLGGVAGCFSLRLAGLIPGHPWAGGAVALLLVAVPILDCFQVTLRRLRRGQPVWQGDRTHLSHELMRRGFNPVHAVVILWLGQIVSVGAAVALFCGCSR
ncbi:MAG: MraY family glycosyltransferase [Verrucomicrobiae bacterium]|nr:MraY family glycosyltransferase [Verrucomicrobiae bacterium]